MSGLSSAEKTAMLRSPRYFDPIIDARVVSSVGFVLYLSGGRACHWIVWI